MRMPNPLGCRVGRSGVPRNLAICRSAQPTYHTHSCHLRNVQAAASSYEPAATDVGGSDSGNSDGGSGGRGKVTAITAYAEDDDNNSDEIYRGWNPFKKLSAGMRSRMAADPDFLFKLGVECSIDAVIILGVNYAARGENFFSELEFVFCQVLVSCSNDFALVYLLAPILARKRIPPKGLGRLLQSLPPHVFASGHFTPAKRLGCFLFKIVQYGIVGFTMGCLGSAGVNQMTNLRELTDTEFEPPAEAPSALMTGLGWLFFMGVNSNIRYNLVSAGEQHLYMHYPGAISKLGSIALRLANNFAGAYQWVELADELGVSQPRKSLREEARQRQQALKGPRWMLWRRNVEPEKWYITWLRSLQPRLPAQLSGASA